MTRPPSHRLASAAVLGALAASACAGSPPPGSVVSLLGCWRFERDEVARELRLPWGVHLLDGALEGWPAMEGLEDTRSATSLTESAEERDYPFGYWRLLAGGDSVRLGYPGGGGLVADLGITPPAGGTDAALDGTVRGVGDVVPLDAPVEADVRRTVILTRIGCPEPGTAPPDSGGARR